MPEKKRPLSPHIQIYRPQITSVLSILHRITGICLTLCSFILVLWLLALASGPEWFGYCRVVFTHPLGKIFICGMLGCFFFHLFGGIRHLVWDSGYGFRIEQVYRSGYLVLALSLLATLVAGIRIFSL